MMFEICDDLPYEPDDYDYQLMEEEAQWDGWTDDEIREYLMQDRIDEMMLQAIIERGEAE